MKGSSSNMNPLTQFKKIPILPLLIALALVAAKLTNISTRGFVSTGNNVMIGGVIVGAGSGGGSRVVVRAIGPNLGEWACRGISGSDSSAIQREWNCVG